MCMYAFSDTASVCSPGHKKKKREIKVKGEKERIPLVGDLFLSPGEKNSIGRGKTGPQLTSAATQGACLSPL